MHVRLTGAGWIGTFHTASLRAFHIAEAADHSPSPSTTVLLADIPDT